MLWRSFLFAQFLTFWLVTVGGRGFALASPDTSHVTSYSCDNKTPRLDICPTHPANDPGHNLCKPGISTKLLGQFAQFECDFNSTYCNLKVLHNNVPGIPAGALLTQSSCSSVLKFEHLSDCHGGTYSFHIACGNCPPITEVHRLIVLYRNISKLNVQAIGASNNTLIKGTTASIECSFYPGSFSVTPEFFFKTPMGGFARVENNSRGFMLLKPTATRLTLVISNVSQHHATTYRCIARSASGCSSDSKNMTTRVGLCPRGHYCERDASKPMACPAGTFNPDEGKFTISSCRSCPPGFYCPEKSVVLLSCGNITYGHVQSLSSSSHFMSAAGQSVDCQQCPLTHSCSEDGSCKFLCSYQKRRIKSRNGRVHLLCHFSNDKIMTFVGWFKGHAALRNSSRHTILTNSKRSMLVIQDADPSDSALYSCNGWEHYMRTNFSEKFSVSFLEDKSVKRYMIATGSPAAALAFLVVCVVARHFYRKLAVTAKAKQQRQHVRLRRDVYNVSSVHEFCNMKPVSQLVCNAAAPYEDERGGHLYDVFICYSSVDCDWVRCTLLKKLDSLKITTCIDFKDFAPGETIIQNISDAIDRSKKTIAVLSPDFLGSVYCQQELQSALKRKDDHEVIPILYKRCDVPDLLKDKTYLDWEHCDIKPYFWSQLVDALKWTPPR